MALLLLLLFSLFIGYYAHRRGRNTILWTLLSILISPLLAGIILALLKDKRVQENISELRFEQEQLRDRISGDEKLTDMRFRDLDAKLGSSNPAAKLTQEASPQEIPAISQDIKYCPKCGTSCQKDDKFCPHCGARLERGDINEQ